MKTIKKKSKPMKKTESKRPMTEALLKLIEKKGQLKIDASDVVKIHSGGSVTIKMRRDEMLAARLLEFTASSNPKQAKEAAELVASYVLSMPLNKRNSNDEV
ncbi:hypothetical protein [Flagellimonas allohymeniacidonis]|uniref:Uncharacterized protein n=1 Tax=Flagellimonas allohymeniacidonis TaxID=2517819 RepID=A0A4Q8QJQ5_9FLAO|nr:hypothetical protein [Allomuricauda hymeniacidonis]TAI48466.1 hypothetical protein EW142_01285 [Allomuricauda hymeniacidonis]